MRNLNAAILFAALWTPPLPPLGSIADAQPPPPMPQPDALVPAITLDGPKTAVAPGKLVHIVAKTSAKRVTWRVPTAVDFETSADTMKITCAAPANPDGSAVTYTIEACVADANGDVQFATKTFTVQSPTPPPPPDKFKAELQALAAGQDKAQLALLASLYRACVGFTSSANIKTTAELIAAITSAADERLKSAAALQPIRTRVLVEIHAAGLPPDAPLTEALRAAAADIYGRAAVVIEAASK